LRFLRGGGKEAIITSCDRLREAVAGSAGTHILANSEIAGIPLKLDLELPVGGR